MADESQTRTIGPADQTPDPTLAPTAHWESTHRDSPSADVFEQALPRMLGDYQLLHVLGRGGMGVVFLARQRSADRLVAVKLVRSERMAGLTDTEKTRVLERFHAEAQAAARLDHDHAVSVFEVGDYFGVPYYSMRFVPGKSLQAIVAERPLDGRRAARYTRQIAAALQAAHEQGVLHRDVKPQNILLDETSDRALIADFGLAKFLAAECSATLAGEVFGSPPYMSPEQARDSSQTSAAGDIYSLGATLYHLVTGRPPFQAANAVETLRQVVEETPPRPRDLNRAIDRDLETICLKCLEKIPGKRYATAGELGQDLDRYLRGEPIAARPVGPLERGWRWCRRKPAIAGLAFGLALAMIVGTAVSVFFMFEAEARATDYQRAERQAVGEAANAEKQKLLAQAEAAKAVAAERKTWRNLYIATIDRARAALDDGHVQRARELLADYLPQADREDPRDFEWYVLWGRCHRPGLMLDRGAGDGRAWSLAFSPDNARLAIAQVGRIALWRVADGARDGVLEGHKSDVTSVAYLPTGELVSGCGYRNGPGEVFVWNVAEKKVQTKLRTAGDPVVQVAVSRDGRRVAAATAKLSEPYQGMFDRFLAVDKASIGKVIVWDRDQPEPIREFSFPNEGVISVGLSSDGAEVVAGSSNGLVRLLRIADGESLQTFEPALPVQRRFVWTAKFSPDDKRIAIARGAYQEPGEVLLIDRNSLTIADPVPAGAGGIFSLDFSPDGTLLAAGGWDRKLRVWRLSEAFPFVVLAAELAGHTQAPFTVRFSPNQRMLASGTFWGGEARLWNVSAALEVHRGLTNFGSVTAVVFGAAKDHVRWTDLRTGEMIEFRVGPATGQLLTSDRGLLFVEMEGGELHVWNIPARRFVKKLTAGPLLGWQQLSPKLLAVWTDNRGATFFDLDTAEPCPPPSYWRSDWNPANHRFPPIGVPSRILYQPRGETAAFSRAEYSGIGKLQPYFLLNTQTSQVTPFELKTVHTGRFFLTQKGDYAVAAGDGRPIQVWDTKTGLALGKIEQECQGIAAHAERPEIYGGGTSNLVRCWSLPSLTERWTGRLHTDIVWSLAVSPNSKRLASIGWDGVLGLWNTETGELLTSFQAPYVSYPDLQFNADGTLLRMLSRGNIRTVWRVPPTSADGSVVQPAWPPAEVAPFPDTQLPPAAAAPSAAENTEFVAWWKDSGGSVSVDAKGNPIRMWYGGTKRKLTDKDLARLPALPFATELSIHTAGLSARGLRPITTLPRLHRLVLSGPVEAEGFQLFEQLPALSALALNESPVDDARLAVLARLTRLRELSVYKATAGSDAWRGLAGMENLTSLHIAEAPGLNDAVFDALLALPELKSLQLLNTGLQAAPLPTLPNLESLWLAGRAFRADSFARIQTQPRLKYLRLDCPDITDEVIASLAPQPTLEALDLSRTLVISPDLQNFPRLQRLLLDGTRVDDATLQKLSLPDLAELHVSSTAVTVAGLESLARLKKLKRLSAARIQPSSADFSELRTLESLSLDGVPFDESWLPSLLKLDRLQSLFLDGRHVKLEDARKLLERPALRQLILFSVMWSEEEIAAFRREAEAAKKIVNVRR